jgi:hypothetical protein
MKLDLKSFGIFVLEYRYLNFLIQNSVRIGENSAMIFLELIQWPKRLLLVINSHSHSHSHSIVYLSDNDT